MIIANLSKKYLESQFHSIRSNFFEPKIECYIADSKKEIKAARHKNYNKCIIIKELFFIKLNNQSNSKNN